MTGISRVEEDLDISSGEACDGHEQQNKSCLFLGRATGCGQLITEVGGMVMDKMDMCEAKVTIRAVSDIDAALAIRAHGLRFPKVGRINVVLGSLIRMASRAAKNSKAFTLWFVFPRVLLCQRLLFAPVVAITTPAFVFQHEVDRQMIGIKDHSHLWSGRV